MLPRLKSRFDLSLQQQQLIALRLAATGHGEFALKFQTLQLTFSICRIQNLLFQAVTVQAVQGKRFVFIIGFLRQIQMNLQMVFEKHFQRLAQQRE